MSKHIHDFEVISNQHYSRAYFVLKLRCRVTLPAILPGQFAQVQVPASAGVYLRRPISFYDVDNELNTVSLLIKSVGPGTRALELLQIGDQLNMVYPLGNHFNLPSGKKALLVGGGVGIAPMLLLAKHLHENGFLPDVVIGGRTEEDIVGLEKLESLARVYIATDNGSLGIKGLVTEHPVLRENAREYSKIYACGPDPMMKAVAGIAGNFGIECEVSLEQMMACGIGACLCCVVGTTSGNKTSCVDGPVFNTRELKSWI